MGKLDEYLNNYFHSKVTGQDGFWQNKEVIISGHLVPGEGEHKIMKFIREMRSEPQYNVNLTHCIYGEDADLLIMGLCIHNTIITVVREVVMQFF